MRRWAVLALILSALWSKVLYIDALEDLTPHGAAQTAHTAVSGTDDTDVHECEEAEVQPSPNKQQHSAIGELFALGEDSIEHGGLDGSSAVLLAVAGSTRSRSSSSAPSLKVLQSLTHKTSPSKPGKKGGCRRKGTHVINSKTHLDIKGLPKHYLNPAVMDPQMRALTAQSSLTRGMADMITTQMKDFKQEMKADRKRNKRVRRVDRRRWRALRSLEKMQNRAVANALMGTNRDVGHDEFNSHTKDAAAAQDAAHGTNTAEQLEQKR